MKKPILSAFAFVFSVVAILLFSAPASAGGLRLQENQLENGKYFLTIAGCTSCHTPLLDEYANPQTWTLEQIRTLAFNESNALNWNKELAGGRVFDLGPAGVVFTKNLTPDKITGLGDWSDTEIKAAVKTGLEKSGEVLFPVMPYHTYNSMADADLDAIVIYLRSVKAVRNQVPPHTVSTEGMQALPMTTGIIAPDNSDPVARGAYLVNSVMACTDCHTSIDPSTGAPQMDKYLAGGQPFEGPWGIVYGGNITPDAETGLGDWTEAEIVRAFTQGISRDGRRLILMPWFAYASLTEQDANAVAAYLKSGLPAVSNPVPAAALNPDFVVMETAGQIPGAPDSSTDFWKQPIALAIAAAAVVLLISLGLYLIRRRSQGS